MAFHHNLLTAAYGPLRLAKDIGRQVGLISPNSLRVLLYHDIAPKDYPVFAEQLRWLARRWTFVSPDQFSAMLSGHEPILGQNLLITFDDGFLSNREVAEKILNPLGIRALFFVVSDFVGIGNKIEARQFIADHIYPCADPKKMPPHWSNMGWSDLEALLAQGHSLGGHTQTHSRLSQLDDLDLEREIVGSADTIALRLGTPVEHFAYTFGDVASFNQRAMLIARSRYRYIYSGVRGDNVDHATCFSVRRDAVAAQDAFGSYSLFSKYLTGSLLNGSADIFYGSAKKKLDSWASKSKQIIDNSTVKKKNKARVIAFYLPQFHPIPENNLWWGQGFTEWTNVAKAVPLFDGHEQPHIPADLGFYDLRLPETRLAQARMALTHGIEGFCYWHYWFAGRRLLERPFDEVLSSGEPDFPFCLGWANETWTGVWKGEPNRILVEQTYPGEDDDRAHFDYLLKAFRDHRYITVDGKPLLVIYKPLSMPGAKHRFDFWRDLACKSGLAGLYIIGTNMLDFDDAEKLGLDGAMISTMGVVSSNSAVANEVARVAWGLKRRLLLGGPRVIEYAEAIKHLVPDLSKFKFSAYPTIFPNWDHTPRMGRKGVVLANSNPDLFEALVRNAVDSVQNRDDEHKIVFLKSWNEWAEGNYMEPDTRWGDSYLEALSKAIK